MARIHEPVLAREAIDLLKLDKGDSAIDATLDGGGHAKMISAGVGETGKILGIERDQEIIRTLKLPKNIKVVCGNFADIENIAIDNEFNAVGAILFDLGLSSWHLEMSGRGFSFQRADEPLLMNFGSDFHKNAAEILNGYRENELIRIFKEYGEERKSVLFAKKIVKARKEKRILSVGGLERALGVNDRKVLARIFQALRIEVNSELENLKAGLGGAFIILKPAGRLAVISYHSLEDRIVKNFMKEKENIGKAYIITKKPVTPAEDEILKNSKSRSAKLRVMQRL